MVDTDRLRTRPPFEVRTLIDDGNFGGRYQRDDSEMLEIWDVAVRETRALLQEDW
jgi:creatinine amidohydrolase